MNQRQRALKTIRKRWAGLTLRLTERWQATDRLRWRRWCSIDALERLPNGRRLMGRWRTLGCGCSWDEAIKDAEEHAPAFALRERAS